MNLSKLLLMHAVRAESELFTKEVMDRVIECIQQDLAMRGLDPSLAGKIRDAWLHKLQAQSLTRETKDAQDVAVDPPHRGGNCDGDGDSNHDDHNGISSSNNNNNDNKSNTNNNQGADLVETRGGTGGGSSALESRGSDGLHMAAEHDTIKREEVWAASASVNATHDLDRISLDSEDDDDETRNGDYGIFASGGSVLGRFTKVSKARGIFRCHMRSLIVRMNGCEFPCESAFGVFPF